MRDVRHDKWYKAASTKIQQGGEDEKNPLGYSTIPSFDCKNLAAALWIQFYNLVTSYQKLIKCKNKYCKRYFEKDGKREYDSPSCKKAQNMRDWRARKKLKSWSLNSLNFISHIELLL